MAAGGEVSPRMSGPAHLIFRGVRGSMPTADAKSRGYGGNTSCLELALGSRRLLLLDCGTGLRAVEATLPASGGGDGFQFEVLLTHYHWDHVMGLPFFKPLYDPRSRFTFYGRGWQGGSIREVLEDTIAPPSFPVALRDTSSIKTYVDLDEQPFSVGGLRVRHARLRHPQGVTAFRLERGGRSVVYATDTERGEEASDERLRALAFGADVLIHDAQYTPEEYERTFRGWGHSTWRHAVQAAHDGEVGRLLLFHHDPDRSDDEVDAIVAAAAREFPSVAAAREGEGLEL